MRCCARRTAVGGASPGRATGPTGAATPATSPIPTASSGRSRGTPTSRTSDPSGREPRQRHRHRGMPMSAPSSSQLPRCAKLKVQPNCGASCGRPAAGRGSPSRCPASRPASSPRRAIRARAPPIRLSPHRPARHTSRWRGDANHRAPFRILQRTRSRARTERPAQRSRRSRRMCGDRAGTAPRLLVSRPPTAARLRPSRKRLRVQLSVSAAIQNLVRRVRLSEFPMGVSAFMSRKSSWRNVMSRRLFVWRVHVSAGRGDGGRPAGHDRAARPRRRRAGRVASRRDGQCQQPGHRHVPRDDLRRRTARSSPAASCPARYQVTAELQGFKKFEPQGPAARSRQDHQHRRRAWRSAASRKPSTSRPSRRSST